MAHYITVFIKQQELNSRNQYNILSEQYNEAKSKIDETYGFTQGKVKVYDLQQMYPNLEFELKPLGD